MPVEPRLRRLLLVILLLVFALPFLYLPLLSVSDRWVFPDAWPKRLTLQHWVSAGQLFGSLVYGLSLSLAVSVSATALGFWVSRMLAKHDRRRMLLRLAYLPYAFSPVVYAFCLQYFFYKTALVGTFAGVWLAQLFITFPFCVLVLTPWWSARVFDMENLVYTFGGSAQDAWRRVLLPMARPVLLLCWFQAFLISWFDYGLTSVLGLGRVPTLTVRVFQYIGEANPYVAAASSCLLVLPPLLLLWLNKRALFRVESVSFT
ncbi:MAG: hypothetical protein SFV52_11460 [Saprospiraceae bacterium]|nr:hypothetical protein [Saprospiraceae bacterium]